MPRPAEEIVVMLKERRDFYMDRTQRYNNLIKVWHGQLDALYPGEFSPDEVPKIANFIKLAWDSYATMGAKVPDKIVRPDDLTDREQKRASKLEQIASSYDESSRAKLLWYQHMWYLIGLGSSCRGIVPDFQLKRPRFVVEDPRNVYPSPSFEATYASSVSRVGYITSPENPDNLDLRSARGGSQDVWSGGGLEDIIIEKRSTIGALKQAFPWSAGRLGNDSPDNLRRIVNVCQYYSRSEIVTLVLGRKSQIVELARAYHDLGVCPYRITQTFAPDQIGGISQFEEQVPLLVAYSKILSQKLTYNDRTVWPLTWVQGDVSNISIGPHEVLKLTPGSSMGQLPPPTEFQADRDMAMLDRNIRTLNREGDPLRGEVSGGPITGRGLEQLMRPINSIVEHYWNLDSPDTEALYATALMMDEYFWPNERKEVSGRRRGEEFELAYTPSKDIKGQYAVGINYGFGVGGTEGLIQSLQALGARLMDKRTVMESIPGVRSVNDTLRKIELDRLDDSIYAAFDAGDVPRAQFLAQVREEVASGTPVTEAIKNIPPPPPAEQAGLAGMLGGGGLPGMAAEEEAASLQAGGVPGQAPALDELLGAI